MDDDRDKQRSAAESELQQEIRQRRKFTPKEAIARLAGPGAMKGASPIPPVQQAETEIGTWLRTNVADSPGALVAVLHRQMRGSELLLGNIDRPLAALEEHCRRLLSSDFLLKEVVREADAEWGQRMDERPYFEREGASPHASDPYTQESVRKLLIETLQKLDVPTA